ncbi:MAG: hypothetical protein Q9197_004383 [Variospora fuerteventurae]
MSTAASSSGGEDLARGNYSDAYPPAKVAAPLQSLKDLREDTVGKTVQVRAWIQSARMQGAKMAFVQLREERSWTIQGVVIANPSGTPVSRQMVKWVGGLQLESFVSAEGIIQRAQVPVKSCQVTDYEILLTKVFCQARGPEKLGLSFAAANKAVARIDEQDPGEAELQNLHINKKVIPAAGLATHLSNPVMHKRAPLQQAIADVRKTVRYIFAEYLESMGFNQFEPPCLLGAASEGGANVFKLPYFGRDAFLAQSPQFYKQIEIAGGRKKVYCIGPTFRAENSNTPRHMTEFTCLDLETEIIDHYHEVRHLLEDLMLHIFQQLKQRCKEEIELVHAVYQSPEFLVPEPGREVRLTFAEGQELLREEGPEEYCHVRDDEDMSTPQEKALGAIVRRKFNTDFYILDKFPESARPFYAMLDPENPSVTNSFDYFMRGQEILTGGQRIHLPEVLESRIRAKGINPLSPGIKEYLEVFKSAGVPPHGGGGIGLDRVVAWFLGLPTVHLASYYPRTPKTLVP